MRASKIALLAGAMAGLCLQRDGELPEQTLQRDLYFEVRAESVDEESRTIELSFSSEEPFERWWGTEILDHGAQAVRLGRLNGGAALLMDHNIRDQVGVVEKAWISGGKGRALVRFGRSARADEVFQDVKDGIRKLVSVGYRVFSLALESKTNGDEVYRVMDWEPYEISIVAVPADTTVGVGRDGAPPAFDPRSLISEEEEDMNLHRNGGAGAPAPAAVAAGAQPAAMQVENRSAVPAAPIVDHGALQREAATAERNRIAQINSMGTRLDCAELATRAVNEGMSLDQFIRAYEDQAGPASAIRTAEDPAIGLSDRDQRRYSMVRLMNAIANPTDRRAQDAAGFEFECSAEAQRRRESGEVRGFTVPVDILRASVGGQQRDLTVGTPTAGGNLVATDLLADSFIAMLRNALAIQGMGARVLTDLNGNIAIPRQTGGASAYWVAESGSPTESQQAFDQVPLTPKTVGAFTDLSRKLLLQSSVDIEALVRQDLATVLALALDLAAINGSGASNQPRGILQTAGIASVIGGTNGAAPTWAHIVELETKVSVANAAVGNLGYLTNSKVRGKLKVTERFSGTNGMPVWADDNTLNGYRAAVSNQVPSNLTKGTANDCSATIFGNWSDLMIGMWGGLDLMLDPYTSSTSGTVRIVALQDADVAVRQPASFSAMVDALTN